MLEVNNNIVFRNHKSSSVFLFVFKTRRKEKFSSFFFTFHLKSRQRVERKSKTRKRIFPICRRRPFRHHRNRAFFTRNEKLAVLLHFSIEINLSQRKSRKSTFHLHFSEQQQLELLHDCRLKWLKFRRNNFVYHATWKLGKRFRARLLARWCNESRPQLTNLKNFNQIDISYLLWFMAIFPHGKLQRKFQRFSNISRDLLIHEWKFLFHNFFIFLLFARAMEESIAAYSCFHFHFPRWD